MPPVGGVPLATHRVLTCVLVIHHQTPRTGSSATVKLTRGSHGILLVQAFVRDEPSRALRPHRPLLRADLCWLVELTGNRWWLTSPPCLVYTYSSEPGSHTSGSPNQSCSSPFPASPSCFPSRCGASQFMARARTTGPVPAAVHRVPSSLSLFIRASFFKQHLDTM